jgi:hypothetical protein
MACVKKPAFTKCFHTKIQCILNFEFNETLVRFPFLYRTLPCLVRSNVVFRQAFQISSKSIINDQTIPAWQLVFFSNSEVLWVCESFRYSVISSEVDSQGL